MQWSLTSYPENSVRSTLRSTAPAHRGTGRSSAAAHLLVVLTHLGVMAFVLLQLVELLPLCDSSQHENCINHYVCAVTAQHSSLTPQAAAHAPYVHETQSQTGMSLSSEDFHDYVPEVRRSLLSTHHGARRTDLVIPDDYCVTVCTHRKTVIPFRTVGSRGTRA